MADAAVAEPPKAKKHQSTKPGEPAPKAKREKIKKVDYPGLNVDAEGKVTTRLKDYPADHDPRVHKQLKRHHFENEAPLLERRADELQKRVDALREEAKTARLGGSSSSRGKLKKLKGMMSKFAEMKAELANELTPEQLSAFETMFQAAMKGEPVAEAPKV